MPDKTISVGGLMAIVGLAFGLLSDASSFTKWIVLIVGVLFLALGLAAKANEGMRHHLMHASAALALLAIVATLPRFIMKAGEASATANLSQIVLMVLCAGYLFTAVQSFRAAAAARRAS